MLLRTTALILLSSFAVSVACVKPATEPAPGDVPPPDAHVDQQPAEPSADERAAGAADSPPVDETTKPRFANLIQEGAETVTITVTLTGASEGELEFHTFEEVDGVEQPRMIAIEPFSGGLATILAPAEYEPTLKVGATAAIVGDDTVLLRGDAKGEYTLSGSDLSIAITLDEEVGVMPGAIPSEAGEGEAPAPEAPTPDAPAPDAPAPEAAPPEAPVE